MSEIIKGTLADREEILDFINYVFSLNSAPHDFLKLMPKCYAEDAKSLGAEHYIIKKENKIKALVANRIIETAVGGKSLKFGLIGNVSVHPYSRGAGYMKELMPYALDDAKNLGIDIMVLGGQRQRYGYFGFENGGVKLCYNVSAANIRHCFGELDCSDIEIKDLTEADVDAAKALYDKRAFHALRAKEDFFKIMHTWALNCRAVVKNEKLIGYIYGNFNEFVLENEADMGAVLKAAFQKDNLSEITVSVAPFEKQRIEILSKICENVSVQSVEMINVLNWKNTVEALLCFKAQTDHLDDCELSFKVDGEALKVAIKDGKVTVEEIDDAEEIEHNTAIRMLFGLEALLDAGNKFKSIAPLNFTLDVPDGF